MKKIVLLFFILFSSSVIFADVDFPKPTGFVNDFANVLMGSEEDTLTGIIERLEGDTTSELAVVTVRTVKPLTIEEYSVRLFSKWGIGKKDKNNGVLLLVAVEDREVKIEVGYGLEGILPDGKCGEIIRKYIIPEFKNGRYGNGIIAGASEIAGIISGKRVGVAQTSAPLSETVEKIKDTIRSFMVLFFIIIFVLVSILQMFLPRRRRYWHSGGGYSGSYGGFGGGGFGGFGGGSSGGGGAVGRW